jgi:ureidoglycolate hydrolase
MTAIEFTTQVTDDTIKIPKEHQTLIHGAVHVSVIVLASEPDDHPDMIAHLLAHPLKTQNFTPLNRDEIHERS